MSGKLSTSIRFKAAWDAVHTSFWFTPSLMVLLSPGLFVAAAWIGRTVPNRFLDHQGWLYAGTPDAARDLLSTLLASTITMTSLVFSITIVVLTLAASQFGPRLIRNFMASIPTQLVFGTFLMTIIYCLIDLAALGPIISQNPIAMPTTTLALALVAVSVVLLIPFIHTLARSIVSENIIERVGRELDALLDGLEPLSGTEPTHVWPGTAHAPELGSCGPAVSGYIQSIDFDELVSIAARADLMIQLEHHPGKFVVPEGCWIKVWPGNKLTAGIRRGICSTITTGVNRTPVQDIDYPVRHLVEIAVRALSPSINDPYTAIAVLHRLSASLARLMRLRLPPQVFHDEHGAARVFCPQPDHATILGASFNQIRQYGAGKPVVVMHQTEALRQIGEHCKLVGQLEAIKSQLELLREDALKEVENAQDRAALEEDLATVLSALPSIKS